MVFLLLPLGWLDLKIDLIPPPHKKGLGITFHQLFKLLYHRRLILDPLNGN